MKEIMKVLREICLPILIAFSLISGVTYAQSPAEKRYYRKGVAYAIQGKFTKAKVEFKKALKVNPFHVSAGHGLEIIKDVLAQKIKTETAILLFKGTSYDHQRQYDRAIREFTKALEINPKYAVAYNNRGVVYTKKRQYGRDIRDFNKALEINPKYAEAYYNRGNHYYNQREYDRAIRDFTKAIEINPKYAVAYNNRGVVYRRKGQVDQAIRDFTKATEINPKYVEAYYNRGNHYYNQRQYDRAARDWTKAIEINPKFAAAYDNLGVVYLMKLGNRIKGCADFKKACELGKCDNYNILKQKGDCW